MRLWSQVWQKQGLTLQMLKILSHMSHQYTDMITALTINSLAYNENNDEINNLDSQEFAYGSGEGESYSISGIADDEKIPDIGLANIEDESSSIEEPQEESQDKIVNIEAGLSDIYMPEIDPYAVIEEHNEIGQNDYEAEHFLLLTQSEFFETDTNSYDELIIDVFEFC